MLTSSVNNLEEEEKAKNELLEWIEQQKLFIIEWKSKPLKLRIDTNTSDLSNVQATLKLITNKKEESARIIGTEDVLLSQQLNMLRDLVKIVFF